VSDQQPRDRPSPSFSWSAHPARERRAHAAGSLFAIAALAVAAWQFGQHPGWALIAVLVLILALNRFFFPSRFIVDGEGITAHYPMRRRRCRWQDLRRFVHDDRGGYLSTRALPSRLDAFRGLHVLFGAERARVVAEIRRHMVAQEAQPCSG
jgi:hypothetical protein